MKIKLVFDDWRRGAESIYQSEPGVRLSLGDFHSGSTFDAEIELDYPQACELEVAMRHGYTPVFLVGLVKNN